MKRVLIFILAIFMFAGWQSVSAVNMDSLKQTIIDNSKEIHQLQKDSLILSKLSPNQLLELKKQEFEVRKQEIEKESRNDMPLNGFGIVTICLLPFLFVVIVLIIQGRMRNRESQRHYDLYMKTIEMGQTVPEHFFDEPKKVNPASNLKRGIIWLSVGLSLVVSFLVINEYKGLILGIVPAFVGVGYILVHFLEKPKTEITDNNHEQLG